MSALRPTLGAFAVLTLVLVAACGSTTPSAAPSTAPADPLRPDGCTVRAVKPRPGGSAPISSRSRRRPPRSEVVESACASGQSPRAGVTSRSSPTRRSVTVTFTVEPLPGDAQDCQSNPEFPVTFTLSEPLGGRPLLDGGSTPPRDATTTP